jgi:hypothetical protein
MASVCSLQADALLVRKVGHPAEIAEVRLGKLGMMVDLLELQGK